MVLASLSAWASASAAPELTPSNSVIAPLLVRDSIHIEGIGCGVPASASMALPPNVLDVNVRAPGVGTRDGDARITDVVVQANVVTFTSVDDGEFVCDPNSDSAPPASRPWSADFAAEVGAKRQAPATLRTDWYRRSRCVVRPRVVGLGLRSRARRKRHRAPRDLEAFRRAQGGRLRHLQGQAFLLPFA